MGTKLRETRHHILMAVPSAELRGLGHICGGIEPLRAFVKPLPPAMVQRVLTRPVCSLVSEHEGAELRRGLDFWEVLSGAGVDDPAVKAIEHVCGGCPCGAMCRSAQAEPWQHSA